MLKSKFKFRALLIPISLSAFLWISIVVVFKSWPIALEKIRLIDVLMFFLFGFTILWLLFSEFRTKIIVVEIGNHTIRKKNYLGFNKEYDFRYFDGFKTSILHSKDKSHEYLYLMKDNNKIIKLSEAYHQNYPELKYEITKHIKCLGFEKFSYLDEFKEIIK